MEIRSLACNSFLSDVVLRQRRPADGNSSTALIDYPSHKFLLVTQSKIFAKILEANRKVVTIILPTPIIASKSRYPDFFSYQQPSHLQSQLPPQKDGHLLRVKIGEPELTKVLDIAYLEVENSSKAREIVSLIATKQNCFAYFALCQSLGFTKVQAYFEKYIVKCLNKQEDAMTLLFDAIQYESDAMKHAALDSVAPKFQEFLRSSYLFNDLINLPFPAFLSLIQRDDISVYEEADVFNVVYQYISKREVSSSSSPHVSSMIIVRATQSSSRKLNSLSQTKFLHKIAPKKKKSFNQKEHRIHQRNNFRYPRQLRRRASLIQAR